MTEDTRVAGRAIIQARLPPIDQIAYTSAFLIEEAYYHLPGDDELGSLAAG